MTHHGLEHGSTNSGLRKEWKGSIAQKQVVQTLYGLSNQIVPRACFPDGIRVSNRPGYKLIDTPVQILYGLVLKSRPHSIPVAIDCNLVAIDGVLFPRYCAENFDHNRYPYPLQGYCFWVQVNLRRLTWLGPTVQIRDFAVRTPAWYNHNRCVCTCQTKDLNRRVQRRTECTRKLKKSCTRH
jgi:hypothetical protein